MNPGRLKSRITFLKRPAAIRDELGGKVQAAYAEAFKLWAFKSERSASRREFMGEHANYVPVFFTVRKCGAGKLPDVAMRIEYRQLFYDILNIIDLENGYLEIESRLVKPL